MKKFLIALLLLIIIAVAGTVYYVTQNLDSFIAQTIEKEGTASLGSQVRVGGVKTSLSEGTASISGITIANPSGYSNAHAISLNSISAEIDYKEQTIKQISINEPIINAELSGSSSNFEDLLNNMPESAESSESEGASSSSDQKITIKKLSLRKATVNLLATDYAPAAKYGLDNDLDLDTSFVMKDFVMTNISGTVDQVTDQISEKLIEHVTAEVKAFAITEVKAQATEQLKEKAKEKLQDTLEDKLDGALGDKLKGLF